MEEFLLYVIRQLVEFPEEMVLTKVETARKVIFKVRLRQSDVGKIIGKHGRASACCSRSTKENGGRSRISCAAGFFSCETAAPGAHAINEISRNDGLTGYYISF